MTDKLRRPDPDLEPLLDIPDVARIFKTSPNSVRRMIARGELPAVRIGKLVRVHPKHVKQIMDNRQN